MPPSHNVRPLSYLVTQPLSRVESTPPDQLVLVTRRIEYLPDSRQASSIVLAGKYLVFELTIMLLSPLKA